MLEERSFNPDSFDIFAVKTYRKGGLEKKLENKNVEL